MSSIFHAHQFFINSEHILDILRAKKWIQFSPHFSPFFTARPTSERYNDPQKVIPEGSMVEYLPVGPKEAPQTIFGKKYFRPEIPNPLSQPSVYCSVRNNRTVPYDYSAHLLGRNFFLS